MLAACLAAKADDIRGHIVDAGSNDAVAYATVTITDSHNRKLTTVSDISGYFIFQDLSSDRYTITVSYLGYHTPDPDLHQQERRDRNANPEAETGQPRAERGGSDGARVAGYHYVVDDRPQSHRTSAAVEASPTCCRYCPVGQPNCPTSPMPTASDCARLEVEGATTMSVRWEHCSWPMASR